MKKKKGRDRGTRGRGLRAGKIYGILSLQKETFHPRINYFQPEKIIFTSLQTI